MSIDLARRLVTPGTPENLADMAAIQERLRAISEVDRDAAPESSPSWGAVEWWCRRGHAIVAKQWEEFWREKRDGTPTQRRIQI